MHGTQDVDPGAADQLVVEDDAVRLCLLDTRDRVARCLRFADHAYALDFAEELDQAAADRRGILDDEDSAAVACFHASQYPQLPRASPSAAADCGCRSTPEAQGRTRPRAGRIR